MEMGEIKNRNFNINVNELLDDSVVFGQGMVSDDYTNRFIDLLPELYTFIPEYVDVTIGTNWLSIDQKPCLRLGDRFIIEAVGDKYSVLELHKDSNHYWLSVALEDGVSKVISDYTKSELIDIFKSKIPLGEQTINSF